MNRNKNQKRHNQKTQVMLPNTWDFLGILFGGWKMSASKPAASTSRLRWEVLEASANKGGNSQEDNFLPKMHLPTTIRRNSRAF